MAKTQTPTAQAAETKTTEIAKAVGYFETKECTVGAVTHTDVFGKMLYYMLIKKDYKQDIMINIGEKTYNKIKLLTQ